MVSVKSILVTGGNTGIGFALCKQLVLEDNCHVFLTARNTEKGLEAVSQIRSAISSSSSSNLSASRIDFIQLDTTNDSSILAAVNSLKQKLNHDADEKDSLYLYGIVNNAGTGFAHNTSPSTVLDTNLYGPKRVCEAFLPLLNPSSGRIVNLGSGAAPMYMSNCNVQDKKILCNPDTVTWEEIETHAKKGLGSKADTMGGYGLSKALLASYTAWFAREHPNLSVSCVSPGYINTNMTRGFGASKSPEEGTVSIRNALFGNLKGNGWYYGSDALRSPLHTYRDPGDPEYDGSFPF